MARYGDPYSICLICDLHLTHPSAHIAAVPGSSWGFGVLLKGLTSVVVLKVEESTGYSLQNQSGLIIKTV